MEDMIKKYTQFIYEQQSLPPMTKLDPKDIAESWDSDDLITEALNDLGESEETEGLAEACELLDLLDEATTSALEKPLHNAHKGPLGQFIKKGGGDRRAALLAKIRAKADEKRQNALFIKGSKGAKERDYWDKIGSRAAHLQAKHGGPDGGHEVSAKKAAMNRHSTNATEGARGKKPGDTWKTSTGHIGAKNSEGVIRYFRDETAARDYAHS
jgi:hypothetical protein